MRKRILSILMALCMVLSLVPTAFAADSSSSNAKTQVYIYLDVINDENGWMPIKNEKGWVTVGYVDIDPSVLAAATDSSIGFGTYKADGTQSKVLKYIQTNGVNDINKLNEIFKTNTNETYLKRVFSEVSWNDYNGNQYGLRQSNGANDYVDDHKKITWHLDGVIDLSQYGLLTINYYKQDGNGNYSTTPTKVETIKKIGTTIQPNDYKDQYADGYALRSAKLDTKNMELTDTVTVASQTEYTLDLYYDPQYTVTFDYNDGKSDPEIDKGFLHDTLSTPAPSRDGYTFIGWKKDDTGDVLEAGKQITITGDASYTAQWKKVPAAVTGTISIDSWTYDGKAANTGTHTVTAERDGKTSEPDQLIWEDANGNELTEAPVNVGTYTLKAVWNATENYTETTASCKFTISPRTVVMTSASDEKVYDGQPLTNGTITESGDGFVTGEGASYTVTGTATDVTGDTGVKNDFTYELNANTRASNYMISQNFGVLKITPKDISHPDTPETPEQSKTGITVTPPDDTIYNGEEQKKPPEVKDGDRVLEEGKDYELSYSEDVTNPGTVTVTITGIGNYTEKTTVTYRILPVPAPPAAPTTPEQPTQTAAPAQPTETKTVKAAGPKTGDDARIGAAAGLMAASAAALAVLLRRRRKDEQA